MLIVVIRSCSPDKKAPDVLCVYFIREMNAVQRVLGSFWMSLRGKVRIAWMPACSPSKGEDEAKEKTKTCHCIA